MPLGEMIDRFTIVKLKIERIGDPELNNEFEEYNKSFDSLKSRGINVKQEWIDSLYNLNGKIWDLEHDIRKGKEGELGLEEVGKRALQIRDINMQRVAIKNEIVLNTGLGFKDIKMNHASGKD